MIELNHTIVPARDKVASARFFARIFGLKVEPPFAHFIPVRVNNHLTFDFDQDESFEPHHYAFKVSEAEFEVIFARIKAEGVKYGSGPSTPDDMQTNNWNGGHGVYFRDPSGHLLELLTAD
jgi:catechol 2,3-dioxygenase-like lactoylglutathione lyase family enzyme